MADEEIVRNPNDAVILNYSQNPVEYQNVPKVWLTHPDSTEEEPVLVPFTYGEAVSKEVVPDFSGGDMAVDIPDGELATELTVKKPEELVPENIPRDKYIAGVGPGTYTEETEELEVELDMSGGDQVVTPTTSDKNISKVTIKKPEELTPANIPQGMYIAGVGPGLFQGGAGGALEPELRFFNCQIDPVEGRVTLLKADYNRLLADTGSYNISVPDTFAGMPVVINPNNCINNSYVKSVSIGPNVSYVGNSMANLQSSSYNLRTASIPIPNGVVNMFRTFYACSNFNQPVTIPNGVVNMRNCFAQCSNFNQPVTIPGSVLDATGLFYCCHGMNSSITIEHGVQNCAHMFNSAWNGFNQPVTFPNTVTNLCNAFILCNALNQPVTIRDGINNVPASYMLAGCSNFNQPVTIPAGINNIIGMFMWCNNFNQPVSIVSGSITNMANVFRNCYNFNQPVTIPDGVTDISNAFSECIRLKQPVTISNSVTTMANAFLNAPISHDMTVPSSVTNMYYAFYGAYLNARNLTILSPNVTNAYYVLGRHSYAYRLNVFVPANSTTNNTFYRSGNARNILAASTYWTNDSANNCYYSSSYNVYVYYV